MADGGNDSSVNASGEGSVGVGGNVTDSVIVTGDKNNVTVINISIHVQGEGQQNVAHWGLPGGQEKLTALDLDDWLLAIRIALAQVPQGAFGPRLLAHLVDKYHLYQGLEEPVEEPDFGEFFDRGLKMKEIRDLFPSTQLVELFGPSGMGKSHMLAAMMQEIDHQRGASFPGKWCYLMANARQEGSYNALIRKIITNCGRRINAGVKPSALAAPLAACLAAKIAKEGADHFLFVIDDADALSAEDLGLLIGEDGPVGRTVSDLLNAYPDIVLHMILVGRRRCLSPEMMERHNRSLLRPISIEPLDEEFVREMLAARFKHHTHRDMREPAAAAGGAAIFQLTGGHPGAIKLILDQLQQDNFTLPVADYPARFQDDVIKLIQRQTRRDLNLGEYLALNVLAVLRHFDITMVHKLIERAILPVEVMGGADSLGDRIRASKSIVRWLGGLCDNTGLVLKEPSATVEPYRVHPVLRQVLPMELQRHNRELLEGLHRQVFEIYDTSYLRLREAQIQMLLLPLQNRPQITLNALYHALCCGMPTYQVEKLAQEYWQLYQDALNQSTFSGDPQGLAKEWDSDLTLRELARRQGILAALDGILRK